MSLRNPLSGLKKLRRRLGVGGDELEGCEADGGEGVGSMGSLPQSEPHAVMEGRHGRPWPGNETDMSGGRVDSMDPPLYSGCSEFSPVNERGDNIGGREAASERREASNRNSYLDLGGEGVAETGPSREGDDTNGEKVDQITTTPLISNSGESGSMQSVPCFSCWP